MKEKLEYQKMVDDENRKKAEKERQWRKFYEDFAHQQQGKINDHTQKVIMPLNDREIHQELKRQRDRDEMQARTNGELIGQMEKKAMT